MAMLTRCPHCDTVFRVTPQQLQKQQGQVRCGSCMQVFDGFRTLSSESDRAMARSISEQRPEPPPIMDSAPAATAPVVPHGPAVPPPAVATTLTPAAAVAVAAHPEPVAITESAPVPPTDVPAAEADDEVIDEPQARNRHVRRWAAAVALLVLALITQLVFFYRVELAAHVPALKPALVAACAPFSCTVPLPQQPRYISIEASDLQVPDATRPGLIQLTATLRSHAAYDLAYPALDLVLTDAQEHTLARRVFLPHDYLEPARGAAPGIPPNAEITVKLDLDTGTLGASGFRLDLLPAPS